MDNKIEELKKRLNDNITNLLYENITYDDKGIDKLKDVIKASVVEVKSIDFVHTNIPIQSYLNNNHLTDEDKIYLQKCKDSKTISDISIEYIRKGNVELINLNVELEKEDEDYWILN